jgi:hypothetical protein
MRSLLFAKPWVLAVGGVALVGIAAAAITLTYTTTSTVTTTVTPPPVQFLAGDDAGPSALTNYVTAYSISGNKTYITTTVKGVPEATLVVGSAFKLTNVDSGAAHSVTLTTPQVTNAYVGAYTIGVYNSGNALQDTLTLTAATPSATFSIPASSTFYGKLTLTLLTGAGADNVALTNAVTLSTS